MAIPKSAFDRMNPQKINVGGAPATAYETLVRSLMPQERTISEYQQTAEEELSPFLGSRAADRDYNQSQVLFSAAKNLFDYGSTGKFGPAAGNFIGDVGAISKSATDAEKQRKLAIGTRALASRDKDTDARSALSLEIAKRKASTTKPTLYALLEKMPDGNFKQLEVGTDFAALNQRKTDSGKPNLFVQTVGASVQTAPAGSENKPYAVFVGGKQVGTYSTAAAAEAQRNKYPNQDFQVTTITGLQDAGGAGGTEDKVYKNITFTRRKADGQYETITESVLRKDFKTRKAEIKEDYGDKATIPRMISDSVAPKPVTAVDLLDGTQTIFRSRAAYDEVKNKFGGEDLSLGRSFVLNDSEKAGTYVSQELDQLRREVQKADKKDGKDPYVTRHADIANKNMGSGTLNEGGALGLPTLPLYKTDSDYNVKPQDLNLLKAQIVSGGVPTENLNITTINALMNKFPRNKPLRKRLDNERLLRLEDDFAYVADGEFFRAKIEKDALSLPSMIGKKYLDQLGAVTGISAPLISALTSLEGFFQANQSNPEASALLQGLAFGNALSNVQAREIFGLEGQKLSIAILKLGETLNITTGAFTGLDQIKAQADVVIGILDNQISQSEKTADRAYQGLTSSQKGVEARNSMVAMIPYRKTLLEIKAAAENLNKDQFQEVLSQARVLQEKQKKTFGPGFDALGKN
jgi:hypothetical protein